MSHLISLVSFFTRNVFLVLLTSACASHSPTILAQAQGDGSELGATIRVTQSNPLEAMITLQPRTTFQRVLVEVANDVAGNRSLCKIDNVVEGQSYSCAVTGLAGADTSALVVSVTGIVGSSPRDIDWISQKRFSIPNASYDREAARKKQDRAEDNVRLETVKPK